MGYLEDIFDNVGEAAVDASSAYLENLVSGVKKENEPAVKPPIPPTVAAKLDYSGMIFVGVGLAAIIGLVLFLKPKKASGK